MIQSAPLAEPAGLRTVDPKRKARPGSAFWQKKNRGCSLDPRAAGRGWWIP